MSSPSSAGRANGRALFRQPRDGAIGVLYLALGLLFAVKAGISDDVGTPQAMGPGFFPFWLGLGLVGLGIALLARASRGEPQAAPAVAWRPLVIVLASVVLFGFLVERAGLVLALLAMTMLSGLASHEFRWRRTLVCAVLLAAFCSVLFVVLLDLRLPLWPVF